MKEILLGMLILTSHSLFADFRINGTLLLDDPWEPIIYMSEIQSFEQMYTVDEEMIVCASKIDSSGSFILKGDFLPKKDRLYRLHLCKKGDPVSTIIIGGKEENFFFLIANHNSQLSITDSSEDTLMTDLMISGDYPNDLLSEIHALVKLTEYQDIQDFPIGRKYMRLAVEEKLKELCGYLPTSFTGYVCFIPYRLSIRYSTKSRSISAPHPRGKRILFSLYRGIQFFTKKK